MSTKNQAKKLDFPRYGSAFLQDLENLDTNREPLIRELLYQGDVWMLAGGPASGKSIIVSIMAMALSAGSPLFGVLETKKKHVYVLQTEGDYEESIERLRSMRTRNTIDTDYICWDIYKYLDLSMSGAVSSLCDRIMGSGFPAEVIILDPIYKLTSLDISTGEGALQIVKLTDRLKDMFNATIILSHHFTKDTSFFDGEKKKEKEDAYYGHSFLKNHVRTSYALIQDDDRAQSPKLIRKKGRGNDTLNKIQLHYDADTMTCQMEVKEGTVLDRIKTYASVCKMNNKTTSFQDVQNNCGLSDAYLRKLKQEGLLERIFVFEEGYRRRQVWTAV